MLSAEATAMPASCPLPTSPLPDHYVQIRGLLRSPSKPSGRGHGAIAKGRAPEAVLGLLPLGIRPSGNMAPTGSLGPAVPTLSALQRLRKPAWPGELSGASLLQAALSLLPPRGGKHGNTEGLDRGSSEPQAPGTVPRSPRQALCQGHNTEGREPQSLAVESRLDKPDESQEGSLQATKQLKHSSLLKPWDPNRLLTHHSWHTPLPTQPRSQVPEFGVLPREMKSRPGSLTRDNWQVGLVQQAHAHPGSTRMTAVRRERRVRKPAMSTQWWQDGPEPRKIDISVGKIYILLPTQKGQVLQLHSRLWRKPQHLATPQLQLLLPEHYGLDLPYQAQGTMQGIPAWLPFPGSELSGWNYSLILGRGEWDREGALVRATRQEQAAELGPTVLIGAWPCKGVSVSAGQASAACGDGQC